MNEDALERERRNCEGLRRRLSDVEAQAAQGTVLEPALADAKNKLKQAEAEVARLQNALNKLKQQLQVPHAVYLPILEFMSTDFVMWVLFLMFLRSKLC